MSDVTLDKLAPTGAIANTEQQQLRNSPDSSDRRKSARGRDKDPDENAAESEQQQHQVDRLA